MTYQPDPLARLVAIREVRKGTEVHYNYWLKQAVEQGYSNYKIAKELGMTEAAIRMYRKRHGI